MALIKGNNAQRLAKDAVVLDLGDLQREADRIIEDAEQRAEAIIAEATQKADELIAKSSEEGYNEGREQGLQAAIEEGREIGRKEALEQYRTQLDEMLQSWHQAIEKWESDRGQMFMQAREDILRFASVVAEKTIRRMVANDSTVIQDQLTEALGMISRPSSLVVAINPDDRPALKECIPDLLERFRNCEHIELRDDSSVTRGGCIIATRDGEIDASIERQLQRIVDAILPPAIARSERMTEGRPGEST